MITAQMLAETPIETSIYGEAISDYELERGKPMPSKLHSVIQSNLGFFLRSRYGSRFQILTELSIRLQSNKYVPDIALYDKNASDWSEEEIEMILPPLLAIEIESPSQATDEMKAKTDKYLAAGVRSVWLVMPALLGVMVFHPGAKARFFSDGDVIDDVLDIRIPIAEIFE
ncbi:MAG: Uma2 family endonuclease [Candidatus Kapaibacteriota bacterium]|jgi:Uma2 family endonuclease